MSAERRLDMAATGRYRLTVFGDRCAESSVSRCPDIKKAESIGELKNVGYGYEILDTETQQITLGPRNGRLVDY